MFVRHHRGSGTSRFSTICLTCFTWCWTVHFCATSSRIRHLVDYAAVISSNVQSTCPTVVPRWLQDDPNRPHEVQRWPQDGFKRPQDGPKRPEDGPQDDPKRLQDGCWIVHFCTTSSRIRHLLQYVAVISGIAQSAWPTVLPRWLQDDPKRPHKAPRWPRDGPKRPQDGPKMAPTGFKMDPKMAPRGPKMGVGLLISVRHHRGFGTSCSLLQSSRTMFSQLGPQWFQDGSEMTPRGPIRP